LAGLLDNFTDLRVVGTGAGSTIYRGLSVADGGVYAVKHVIRTRAGDERFIRQAANEYKVASLFDHPNIIRMYDLLRQRRYLKVVECAVVMEYFPGKMLSRKHKFSLPDLVAIFLQAARALDYMHKLGYVHTDVKPENILVNEAAQVKIIDFGVACKRASTKQRVQGTPDFISPEQLSKKPLDERTDIYNLGATMYKILTGKVTPENVRISAPLKRGADNGHLSLARRGVRDHNGAVPERLAHAIDKCCRRSRSRRWQRMKELEEELVACLKEVAPPDHRFLEEAG